MGTENNIFDIIYECALIFSSKLMAQVNLSGLIPFKKNLVTFKINNQSQVSG